MHPKFLTARITEENKNELKKSGLMAKALETYIAEATIETIVGALKARFETGHVIDEDIKQTSFLIDPAVCDKLDEFAARTGLSCDLIVRLIIESHQTD